MGSLSFAEIVTIVVVILIIFGPDRLPEFARKMGELLSKARQATSQFVEEISGEWHDAADPIKTARDDLQGIKDDLKQAGNSFTEMLDTNLSGSDPNRVGFGTAEPVAEVPSQDEEDGEAES
ncbi:MAG: twin-arginine translocase TatA/TatE family subunit [Acidimicrobiia bacterium]|nr:twin-arginine translocase TatA/TatE family subunit [Acidimicrobiia bacterium]